MEKSLLNEAQLRNQVINYLLENKLAKSKDEAEKLLDEGLFDKIKRGLSGAWDSTKHGLSKLGTITAGGKYFGQSKAKAAAKGQMDAEMAKKGNKMIRDLDKTLKSQIPGFPNVKNKEQFLAGVQAIGQVYESVVAATKLSPDSKGYISPRKANNIIKSLRMYVQKLVDYDLASVYRMFNENDEKYFQENQHILLEAQNDKKTGPLTGSKETETEKVYKSNKLPAILAALGLLGVGFGWLVKQPWFLAYFKTPDVYKTALEPIIQGKTQGVTQQLAALSGNAGKNISGMKVSDFIASMKSHGLVDNAGNPSGNLLNMAKEAGNNNFAEWWAENLAGPEHANQTLAKAIPASGAGAAGAGGDIFTKKIIGFIAKKALVSAGGMTAVGSTLVKLGPIVGPLGIGLVAAGALVKGLRYKGLKSSRMKTLKDLLVSMSDLAVPKTVKQKPEEVAPKTKEQPAAKVTKKRPTKSQQIPAEPSTTAASKIATAPEAPASTANDYKRNRIGFNRELQEAFKIIFNELHKKRIL